MSPPSQNPQRSRPPSSDPAGMPLHGDLDTLSEAELDNQPIDEIAEDYAAFAQPHDKNGVSQDMATLAVNPGLLDGVLQPSVAQGSAHFAEMEDSAIMLELRAGNMSGFDFLIQKYRRPIANFMYRMVHNQAIAEELAQEVFLRVYRSRETYRAEARFSTWLYRIATNLGVNYARDTRHERSASTVYLDQADPDTGTTPMLPIQPWAPRTVCSAANVSTRSASMCSSYPNGNAWPCSCTSTKAWTTNRSATYSSLASPPPNRCSFAPTRRCAKN